MRVINLTVNGLQDAVERGFFQWAASKDADVVCLQNIRCREYKIERHPDYGLEGFEPFFFEGEDENYGGTAIFVRKMPKAIMRGLADYSLDRHGTLIQADYEAISVASVWIPPVRDQASMELQWHFMETLTAHLSKVRRKRRLFIYTGCFQVAHQERDLVDAELHSSTPGFLHPQREWMSNLLGKAGYKDALREVTRSSDEYSWWPTAAELGVKDSPGAWRVDYQICSDDLARTIQTAAHYTDRRFSDHAPLIVDYDVEL